MKVINHIFAPIGDNKIRVIVKENGIQEAYEMDSKSGVACRIKREIILDLEASDQASV